MIVSVLYYDDAARAFCGKEYTYFTDIPNPMMKRVLAPVSDGNGVVFKKALVVGTDLPESVIDDSWRHKVKTITELCVD